MHISKNWVKNFAANIYSDSRISQEKPASFRPCKILVRFNRELTDSAENERMNGSTKLNFIPCNCWKLAVQAEKILHYLLESEFELKIYQPLNI